MVVSPRPGPPCLGSATLTFLRSHGPKSKRSHSGSSRIFPGGRASGSEGRAGRVPGPAGRTGCRRCRRRERAVQAAGAGGSARGLSAERSGAAALGAGRGRGRKLGPSRAGGRGGRGGAPRGSNPGRAPRAPSRPAGATEGDFHRDTPRTRPWLRCEAGEGRRGLGWGGMEGGEGRGTPKMPGLGAG